MNKSQIKNRISKDPNFLFSCLIWLADNQKLNQSDSTSLNVILKHVKNKSNISDKHVRLIKRKLLKYHQPLSYAHNKNLLKPIKIKIANKLAVKGRYIVRALTAVTMVLEYPSYDHNITKLIKKNLYGRKFNPKYDRWTAPITYDGIKLLLENNFELTEEISNHWYNWKPKKITVGRELPLRPYQYAGVDWLQTHNGRGIVGDEMGLGKTVQSLAWLYHNPHAYPVLVLTQKSAKLGWRNECYAWLANRSVQVLSGRKDNKINADITIINYDVMFDTVIKKVKKKIKDKHILIDKKFGVPRKLLIKAKFKTIIVDEMQNFSNPTSLRTQALQQLTKKTTHLIGLSGTPIKNRPIEFFPFLNMLDRRKWPSKWLFAQKYCNLTHNGFGWDYSGSSNEVELNKNLQGTMIRRLKKDCLPDLPPKIRTIIPIQSTNEEINYYNEQEKLIMSQVNIENSPTKQMRIIEKLKQVAVEIKINHVIEWIEDYLKQQSKLVVFAHHRNVLNKLKQYFGVNCVSIMGGDSEKERQYAIDTFQNDPSVPLFLGSLTACNTAITLTAANATLTIEMLWEPKEHEQAEDRIHRFGQKHDSVFAYYAILDNTIEMDIVTILDEKIRNISKIIDGKPASAKDLFKSLMMKYNKKCKQSKKTRFKRS